jgi:hypothetical protein
MNIMVPMGLFIMMVDDDARATPSPRKNRRFVLYGKTQKNKSEKLQVAQWETLRSKNHREKRKKPFLAV